MQQYLEKVTCKCLSYLSLLERCIECTTTAWAMKILHHDMTPHKWGKRGKKAWLASQTMTILQLGMTSEYSDLKGSFKLGLRYQHFWFLQRLWIIAKLIEVLTAWSVFMTQVKAGSGIKMSWATQLFTVTFPWPCRVSPASKVRQHYFT